MVNVLSEKQEEFVESLQTRFHTSGSDGSTHLRFEANEESVL